MNAFSTEAILSLNKGDSVTCEFVLADHLRLEELVEITEVKQNGFLTRYLVNNGDGTVVGIAEVNTSDDEDAPVLVCTDVRLVSPTAIHGTRTDPMLPMDEVSAMASLEFFQ